MSSGLETLCGQAYGAEQYQKLGTYTYSVIISLLLVCTPISLLLVCTPISLLWVFVDKLLILIGQDPAISVEAGRYTFWLIPALFPYAILQSLIRFLQTQSLILPMLLSSVTALLFHVPLCWNLVFKVGLGSAGAALAIGLSHWFNVILLLLYVKYSSACKKTRAPYSGEVLPRAREFFGFAIPSAVVACLEWWSCQIVVLLSGLLPNSQLETSVLSVCLMISSLLYFLPYSIGAAASTRVSNELGAGRPNRARASVWAASSLSTFEAIISCAVLLLCRRFLGYAFSTEKEVVDYLGNITPFVCLLHAMDSVQAVLSGVARGSGWQHIGAYINLSAFYLIGLPVAVLLGSVLRLQGKGLWLGLNTGSIVQAILLTLITCSTDWKKQASMARRRIFDGAVAHDENN